MRCGKSRQQVLRLVDGELPLNDLATLDAHLARCPACQAFHEAHVRIQEMVVTSPEPRIDRGFEDAFIARLNEKLTEERAPQSRQEPGSSHELGRHRLLPRPSAAVAIVAVAAGLALWIFSGWFEEPSNRSLADNASSGTLLATHPHETLSSRTDPAGDAGADPVAGPETPATQHPRGKDPEGSALPTGRQPSEPHTALAPGCLVEPDPLDDLAPGRPAEVKQIVRETVAAAAGVTETEVAGRILSCLEEVERERWPLDTLVGRLVKDSDLSVARKAVAVLGAIDTPTAARYLRVAFERPELREAVLRSGVTSHATDLVTVFTRALDDPALFKPGLDGLRRAGDREARRSLRDWLATNSQSHTTGDTEGTNSRLGDSNRAAAAFVLAGMGDEAAPDLLRLVEAGAPVALVAPALQSMGETARRAVVAGIEGRIRGVSPRSAMQLVGPLQVTEAARSLARFVRRNDRIEAAASALGDLATPEALRILFGRYRQLEGTSAARRLAGGARHALDQGRMSFSEIAGVIDPEASESAWIAYIRFIEQAGGDVAASVLATLFGNQRHSEPVRLASAEALSHIGSQRHLAFLLDWATSHPAQPPELVGAAVVSANRLGGPQTLAHLETRLGRAIPPKVRRGVEKLAVPRTAQAPTGALRRIGRDVAGRPGAASGPSPPRPSSRASPAAARPRPARGRAR